MDFVLKNLEEDELTNKLIYIRILIFIEHFYNLE